MEYKYSSLFKWSSGKPVALSNEGNIPVYGSNGIVGYSQTGKYCNKIILGRVGAYCGSVEYCAGKFNATDNTLITECNEDLIDYRYAYYMLKVANLNYFSAGAAQPLITQSILKRIRCDIPSLPTQKRITDILSAYDDLIENNNRRIALLEKAAQELYKEWFARRRNPDWDLVKLSQFGYSVESGSRPKGGIDGSLQEGYPSLGAEAIGKLGEFDFSSTKLVPAEFYHKLKRGLGRDKDILLYKDGAYIGKVTLFMDEFPYKDYAINEHVFLMRSNDPLYQYYLYFTLSLPQYFTQMQNLNRNAAQPGLTGKDLDILKLYRPDEETTKKFNAFVEPVLHNIFSLAKQNQNLTKQRDFLLPRLMSGKLEV